MPLSVPAKSGYARLESALTSISPSAKLKLTVGAAWLGSGLWALSSAHWSGTVIVTGLQFSSLFGPLGIFIAASATIIVYLAYKAASWFMRCINDWRNRRNAAAPALAPAAPPVVVPSNGRVGGAGSGAGPHPLPQAAQGGQPGSPVANGTEGMDAETIQYIQSLVDENHALRQQIEMIGTRLANIERQQQQRGGSGEPVPAVPVVPALGNAEVTRGGGNGGPETTDEPGDEIALQPGTTVIG